MVQCDLQSCSRWYHFGCVGVTSASLPDEVWICPQCVSQGTAAVITDADVSSSDAYVPIASLAAAIASVDGITVASSSTTAGAFVNTVNASPSTEPSVFSDMPPLASLTETPLQQRATPVAEVTASAGERGAASAAPLPTPWEFAAAFTQLPYRVACYANATDPRVARLRASMKRNGRNGGTTADDTVQTIQRLTDAGWATDMHSWLDSQRVLLPRLLV